MATELELKFVGPASMLNELYHGPVIEAHANGPRLVILIFSPSVLGRRSLRAGRERLLQQNAIRSRNGRIREAPQ